MTGPQEALAAWAAEKMKASFVPPYSTIGAVDDKGEIIAVMVFNMYTQHDVEISVAAKRMSIELLKASYDYVVNQLGCRRATYRTRSDNQKAQRALERLGAKLEGTQRLYFGDCDGLLYGILKEEFPFGLDTQTAHTA